VRAGAGVGLPLVGVGHRQLVLVHHEVAGREELVVGRAGGEHRHAQDVGLGDARVGQRGQRRRVDGARRHHVGVAGVVAQQGLEVEVALVVATRVGLHVTRDHHRVGGVPLERDAEHRQDRHAVLRPVAGGLVAVAHVHGVARAHVRAVRVHVHEEHRRVRVLRGGGVRRKGAGVHAGREAQVGAAVDGVATRVGLDGVQVASHQLVLTRLGELGHVQGAIRVAAHVAGPRQVEEGVGRGVTRQREHRAHGGRLRTGIHVHVGDVVVAHAHVHGVAAELPQPPTSAPMRPSPSTNLRHGAPHEKRSIGSVYSPASRGERADRRCCGVSCVVRLQPPSGARSHTRSAS
jgi:hypothetical protein